MAKLLEELLAKLLASQLLLTRILSHTMHGVEAIR